MFYFFKAIKLLWFLQNTKNFSRRNSFYVNTEQERTQCDFYKVANGRARGLIVFIHGMNVLDTRDARLIKLATSFNRIGLDVIMPRIPSIAQLEIKIGQIEIISRLLLAIGKKRNLSLPNGKFGLVSISFSGGLVFLSNLNSETKKYVNAMLLIGSFASVSSVTNFLLYRDNIDDYGKNIMLYNFVRYLHPLGKNIEQYFYLSAICASLKNTPKKTELRRKTEQLVRVQKGFSKKEEALLDVVLREKTYLKKNWYKATKYGAREIYDELNPVKYVDKIDVPIILVHGLNDPVIPASESVLLAQKLRKKKKVHRFNLTSLLGHGDYQLNLKLIYDIFSFSRSLSFFLKLVMRGKKTD